MDLTILQVGILKIAYLAVYEYLGDAFLADPLNAEWQKAIRITTAEKGNEPKLQTISNDLPPIFKNILFPTLADHEHAVTVCNLQQVGPVVAVRLFNSDILSGVYIASDSSNFGLSVLEGKIVVCDSITKKATVRDFESHFVECSERLAGGTIPTGGNL